jgi:hypothetical protein
VIARLTVVVPFPIVVADGEIFPLYTYENEGYTISARPPVKTEQPLHVDLPNDIRLDGKVAFAANALRFDFRKAEFDRRSDRELFDPSVELMQRTVRGFIARLRYVTRSAHVQPVDLARGATWRLQYLNDDESELPPQPELLRGVGGKVRSISLTSVPLDVWESIHELEPDWAPPVWDDILLDATNALPRIGTAVVLAATALEVFIADVLERLAKNSDVPRDVWQWMNERRDIDRNPSTEEQFDVLLKHFVGRSLKDEQKLWQIFTELRTARNKFVHEGTARAGGNPITFERAGQLVASAGEIISTIRGWLPAEHQWTQFQSKSQLSFTLPLI